MEVILISILSEYNLNLLLTAQHFSAKRIIPLITVTSASENWVDQSLNVFNRMGFKCEKPILLKTVHEHSVQDVSELIYDLIKGNLDDSSKVIVNLGNGSRQQILGLWDAMYKLNKVSHPSPNLIFAAPDIKRLDVLTYQLKQDGGLVETISKLKPKLSFKEMISLKGYDILNYNESLIEHTSQLGDYLSAACVGTEGDVFECEVNKLILEPVRNVTPFPFFQVFKGIKISSNTAPGSTSAEYDLLIFTGDLKVYIIEAKSGKNAMLKQIEGQQKLASNWGGRFSDFSAVVQIKDTSDLVKYQKRYKTRGIQLFAGPGSVPQKIIPPANQYLFEKNLI